MSSYSFIATTIEMPEIETKAKYITVKEAIALNIKPHELVPWEAMDPQAEVLMIENEEDLHDLTIRNDTYYDVSGYTSAPFIYEVEFKFSEARAKKLLAYLIEHMREGQRVELWKVWIDDEIDIPTIYYELEQLAVQHLVEMYDWHASNYREQCCYVIEKGYFVGKFIKATSYIQ